MVLPTAAALPDRRSAQCRHMLMGIIADTMQIDRDDLKRRRAQSVKNVKSTNGRVSLEKRAQLWDETTDWDDGEWQS